MVGETGLEDSVMRRWIAVLGTVLVFAVALPASADRDWNYYDFEKKVQKLAVHRDSTAKVFCVCQDGGTKHSHAGWLDDKRKTLVADGNYVFQVRCLIPTYDPADSDSLDNYGYCLTFEVLSK
jgi:hypothetical protein